MVAAATGLRKSMVLKSRAAPCLISKTLGSTSSLGWMGGIMQALLLPAQSLATDGDRWMENHL